jgi:hypothetical protein
MYLVLPYVRNAAQVVGAVDGIRRRHAPDGEQPAAQRGA